MKKPLSRAALAAHARMLADFADSKPAAVTQKTVDKIPSFDVALHVGKLLGVIYEVNGERRIHEFRERSAPELIASADGGQLAIMGGRYKFTARGIVDT